jgi:hypothetical protein
VSRESAKSKNWAIRGGVGVLVVTGFAGFAEFAQPGATVAYRIAGVALLAVLLVAAFFLARFVSEHSDEIGEARFDTRNKDRTDD